MKSLQILKLLSIITVIILILSVNAQMRVFRDLKDVEYIQTEHFNIIYKQKLDGIARETALIAEAQYDTLTRLMDSRPIARINILITDQADIPNGFAAATMGLTINLYMTNPEPDFIIKHRHWIEFVLLHEMTHILNMSATNPSCLKYLNNNLLYFPNTLMPMWILEGVTVYNESTILSGRLRDTNYEAYLRAMILDSTVLPLYRAADALNRQWPYGTLGYLYGGYIVNEYMKRGYDIKQFNNIQPFTCIPIASFLPDIMTKLQLKHWPSDMLSSALKDAESRSQLLINGIDQSERIPVTEHGGYNSNPLFIEKYDQLYYKRHSDYSSPFFVSSSNSDSILFYTSSIKSAHFDSENDKLYYEYLEIYDNVNYFYDIYSYDFNRRDTEKLPNTRRGMLPVIMSNGKLIFIRNNPQTHYLIIYDIDSHSPIDSILFDESYRFHSLDIDNDDRIIAGVYREGGYSDIALINIDNKTLEFLTSGRLSDFKAKWSEKYNGFYFVSDYSGANAVYLYSFDDSLMYPVYQSYYNVSDFDIDEDNDTIYVKDLSGQGYNIYKAELAVDTIGIIPELTEYTAYEPMMNKHEPISAAHSYKPFLHYSSLGTYLFLPYMLPPPDSNSTTSTMGIAGFNMNSDIALGSGYQFIVSPFSVFYDSEDSSYLYSYNINFNTNFLYFNPDIYFYSSIYNDSSDIYPDYSEISFQFDKKYSSIDQYRGLSFSIQAGRDSQLTAGPSLTLYKNTLNWGVKSTIPSSGYDNSLSIYSYYNFSSAQLDYGFKYYSENYSQFTRNISYFINYSLNYSSNDDIALQSDAYYEKPLLMKKIIYLPAIPRKPDEFTDLSYINIGSSIPISYIGMGIPLKWFVSTPIKLDYISFNPYSYFLYSYTDNYSEMILGSSLNFVFSIGGMVDIVPLLDMNYILNEGTVSISFKTKFRL